MSRPVFGTMTVLLTFKVNILDYLNFNSKNIWLGVKSLKCNLFLLNSIQAVIQKLSKIHCHTRFFKLWWFLLTSTVQFIEILQFHQSKYSNKGEINQKQVFCTKSIHVLLLKDQSNKFSHYILGLVVVSISLSDENIKILEI